MALTVKGSRLITVNRTIYRWRLRRKPTYVQECLGGRLAFAAGRADAGGAVLAVEILDVSHPGSLLAGASLIVRPALVAAVIRIALRRGWQPAAPGALFRLSVASEDLPAEVRRRWFPARDRDGRLIFPAGPGQ